MKESEPYVQYVDLSSGFSPAVKKAIDKISRTMVEGFARGQSVQEIMQLYGYDRATVEAVLRRAMKRADRKVRQ